MNSARTTQTTRDVKGQPSKLFPTGHAAPHPSTIIPRPQVDLASTTGVRTKKGCSKSLQARKKTMAHAQIAFERAQTDD